MREPKSLRRLLLLDQMQPGTMLLLHLFGRDNSAAKVCQLPKLLLDLLQPFIPLPVSDLRRGSIPAVAPKLLVCLLDGSNLFPQTPNLISQNP
jgi:hypothetical protein